MSRHQLADQRGLLRLSLLLLACALAWSLSGCASMTDPCGARQPLVTDRTGRTVAYTQRCYGTPPCGADNLCVEVTPR